jgi:Glycosyl transferase family 8
MTSAQADRTAQPEDLIRIHVASGADMERAEIALEYTIHKNVTAPFSITWMKKGVAPQWEGWKTDGWFTDFTCFRFAIPFICGFQGRAVYLDVDTLVLKDLRELWNLRLDRPVGTLSPRRTDVMLIDCGYFHQGQIEGWPASLEEMKKSGYNIEHYWKALNKAGCFQEFNPKWNVIDGENGEPISEIGIIHYSNMPTQPWHPLPQRFTHLPHPRADLAALWWEHYAKALEAKIGREP